MRPRRFAMRSDSPGAAPHLGLGPPSAPTRASARRRASEPSEANLPRWKRGRQLTPSLGFFSADHRPGHLEVAGSSTRCDRFRSRERSIRAEDARRDRPAAWGIARARAPARDGGAQAPLPGCLRRSGSGASRSEFCAVEASSTVRRFVCRSPDGQAALFSSRHRAAIRGDGEPRHPRSPHPAACLDDQDTEAAVGRTPPGPGRRRRGFAPASGGP